MIRYSRSDLPTPSFAPAKPKRPQRSRASSVVLFTVAIGLIVCAVTLEPAATGLLNGAAQVLFLPPHVVRAVAFSPDGKLLASAGGNAA